MNSYDLLEIARIYAERAEVSVSTVSSYMGGSGDTLARLERGHDITTRRADRFAQWLSDHWPSDLYWPAEIPRPPRSVEADQKKGATA